MDILALVRLFNFQRNPAPEGSEGGFGVLNYAGMALQAFSFVNTFRQPRIPQTSQARREKMAAESRERAGVLQVGLEEYRELRSDLRLRIALQNGLFALNAVGLGLAIVLAIGLGAFDSRIGSAIMIGAAIVAPLLGLLWIHNRVGAARIRRHLADQLAPTLQHKISNNQVLAADTRRPKGGDLDYHATIWLGHLIPTIAFIGLGAPAAFVFDGVVELEVLTLFAWLFGLTLTGILTARYISQISRL